MNISNMKKRYIAPAIEEIQEEGEFCLLANSVTWDESGKTEVVNTDDLIDTSGSLDPDARGFFFDD